MAKRKYKYWHELPVGTIVQNKYTKWEILEQGITGYHVKVVWSKDHSDIIGKIHDNRNGEKLRLRDEYFLPHGYNSPLWKVLNGEDYE
jgi:hypothetical protein